MVDKEEEDADSIISDINKSVKIPKINILGTDVKLDVISVLGLLLGGGAALGTGYLLYDQFKNKNDIELARKKQEEEYRIQQLAYQQSLLRERQRQQQQQPLPKKSIPVVEEEPEEQDDSLIDMNHYYKPPEPEKLSYEQMLARANGGYYNPIPTQQPAPVVRGYQPPYIPQPEPTLINTDQYMNNNNSQIDVLPSVAAKPKRKKEEPEEEQVEEGPTPDELYASLGNNSNSYY